MRRSKRDAASGEPTTITLTTNKYITNYLRTSVTVQTQANPLKLGSDVNSVQIYRLGMTHTHTHAYTRQCHDYDCSSETTNQEDKSATEKNVHASIERNRSDKK